MTRETKRKIARAIEWTGRWTARLLYIAAYAMAAGALVIAAWSDPDTFALVIGGTLAVLVIVAVVVWVIVSAYEWLLDGDDE